MNSQVPVPTRRLAWLVSALAIVAVLMPFGLWWSLIFMNSILAIVTFIDWRLCPKPSLFTVTRDLPTSISLGGVGTVVWQVRNNSGRAATVAISDDLAPSLNPRDRRALVPNVEPGAYEEARTTLSPVRRGLFEPKTMTVRVEGPLGLIARQGQHEVPGTLRVNPRYKSRDTAELSISRSRVLEAGVRSTRGNGGGAEFDSMRDYTVDDEIKRIDWAATARTGHAIVRTYRVERNQQVMCLLDCGRTMAARIENEPRIEHAMDAVMMLTHVATRLGDRAGMVAFDTQVRAIVPPSHATSRLQAVTEAMYTLDPRLVESDYIQAFSATLSRYRRRSMLVLFTELAEQAVIESLLPALPLIARDHVVVVAAVTDPGLLSWARAIPIDAGGVYQKAAAVAALEERRRVIFRLQRLGATVIDAAPGRLAPLLADAYLKVKMNGKL